MPKEGISNTHIKKVLKDFLKNETTGEGKNLSEKFRGELEACVANLVFEESKKIQASVPMGATLPNSDASLIHKLPYGIDNEVYYIVWKQVRTQVKGTLQVKYGWQFVVLTGKTYEVRIRHDMGVLYKINDDEVLVECIYKNRKEAEARCNELNSGTTLIAFDAGTVSALDDVVTCSTCGSVVKKEECTFNEESDRWVCNECFAKQVEAEEVVDGKKKEGTDNQANTEGDGRKEVSPVADGNSN